MNIGNEFLIPENPRMPIFRALEATEAKIWLGGALGGSQVEALGEAQAKDSSLRADGRISCWEQAPARSTNLGSPAQISCQDPALQF
jgi:hypothetical protein